MGADFLAVEHGKGDLGRQEVREHEYVSSAHSITLYLEITFCAEPCSKGLYVITGKLGKLYSKAIYPGK